LNVTFVQHSHSGGPGLIRDYVQDRQWNCRRILFPQDIADSPLESAFDDIVVVLGSPHGVYETDVPWIARERLLMRSLVDNAIPVFGVCFGAQLLATAIRGDVSPMPRSYRGWKINENAVDDVWKGPWLRWHGDRIFLPEGVETFAKDDGIVQGFKQGSAVGVQFHPEVCDSVLTDWIKEKSSTSKEPPERLAQARDFATLHAQAIRDRAYALFDRIFSLIT
jgi:GMP synthase (glutamine-hydrolysing)